MYNSDRLTFAFVSSACRAGAVAANYAEHASRARRPARRRGGGPRPSLGDVVMVRAAWVVNAVVPGLDAPQFVAAPAAPSPHPCLLEGDEPRLRHEAGPHALGSLVDSRSVPGSLRASPWCTSHETWRRPDDSVPHGGTCGRSRQKLPGLPAPASTRRRCASSIMAPSGAAAPER